MSSRELEITKAPHQHGVPICDSLVAFSYRKGTRKVAEAYLNYLYTPEAQDIIARNYYRPRDPAIAAKYQGRFARVPLFQIDRNFGGWSRAQAAHFNDGATFDQIMESIRR